MPAYVNLENAGSQPTDEGVGDGRLADDEVDARRVTRRVVITRTRTDGDPGWHDRQETTPRVIHGGQVADGRDRIGRDCRGSCALSGDGNQREGACGLDSPAPCVEPPEGFEGVSQAVGGVNARGVHTTPDSGGVVDP